MSPLLEQVLTTASSVPWFVNVGKDLPDHDGPRLKAWEDWPGPDGAPAEQVSLDLQSLRDKLTSSAPEAMQGWDDAVAQVVERISAAVPAFDRNEDAWHARTSAVWHAAWVLALHVIFVRFGEPVPDRVAEQWRWFQLGHWPAAYSGSANDELRRYALY